MTCDKMTELLSEYLDGCLDWDTNLEIEEHLNSCEKCNTQLAELIKLTNRLKSLPELELPNGFHTDLINSCAKIKNIHKRPKSLVWKIPAAFAAAFFIFLLLINIYDIIPLNSKSYDSSAYDEFDFGSSEFATQNIAPSASPKASSESSAFLSDDVNLDIAIEESADNINKESLSLEPQNQTNDVHDSAEAVQKIIKNSSLTLEVDDFDNTVNKLNNIVATCGGYVDNSSSYVNKVHLYNGIENGELKNGFIVLKIPSAKYDSVKDSLPELGKILSQSENVLDVTMDYIDHEARLSVKKSEEERLLRLMDKAEKIEELILLEQRLANVRADIESFERQLKSWDKLVKYSTIEINISEKEKFEIEEKNDLSFVGQLKDGVSYSFIATRAKIQYLFILAARNIIPISFIFLIFSALLIFFLKKRGKSNNKKDKE